MAAASFADVLDDVLGRASQAAPARAAWAASPGIADSGAFVFARPLTSGTAWTRAYPRPVAPSPRRAVIEVQHPAAPQPEVTAVGAVNVTPIPATPPPAFAAVAPEPPASSASIPPEAASARPAQQAPPPHVTLPRPTPIVRARRVLTVKEQRALDRLLLLGARLDDHFSADELRREYRALALRLHPDRHAHAPVADRAVLAEAFARATASYRCLQAVHGPRA